jgi:hypothetical protein
MKRRRKRTHLRMRGAQSTLGTGDTRANMGGYLIICKSRQLRARLGNEPHTHTTSGAFGGGVAVARVGRCASDERAAEVNAVEIVENVRPRSVGVNDWTGSVAAECADDIDERRKIALEKCEPGDGVCAGVWMVRTLVGDVDVARFGGDEES